MDMLERKLDNLNHHIRNGFDYIRDIFFIENGLHGMGERLDSEGKNPFERLYLVQEDFSDLVNSLIDDTFIINRSLHKRYTAVSHYYRPEFKCGPEPVKLEMVDVVRVNLFYSFDGNVLGSLMTKQGLEFIKHPEIKPDEIKKLILQYRD